MFILNGQPLAVDTPFTANDTQYPANWLRLASAEEKAEIGITEVADPERYDDRYYWGPGLPKDLDTLKSTLVSQVKATAGSLISQSDWKVTRLVETSIPVDEDTLVYRAAVRQKSNELEAAINACGSVPALEALEFSWPSQE
jgi:hypothetical protein